MAISGVKAQIHLEREQHEALQRVARERKVSISQVVRDAVNRYLGREVAEEIDDTAAERAYLADPLWKLPELAEEIGGSGTTDGAANLETELYGPISR